MAIDLNDICFEIKAFRGISLSDFFFLSNIAVVVHAYLRLFEA